MNAEISDKLAHSIVKHVPMLLDKKKFYDFFLFTNIDVLAPYTFFGESSVKEEINGLESYCLFYPILLIRNDAIKYVPDNRSKFLKFLRSLKSDSPDYLAQIQSEKNLVDIMNNVALQDNVSGYSILGIIENVNFTYSNGKLSEDEKKFVIPQLIIPGHEYNSIIKTWETSKSKSYSNMGITFRREHLYH